MSEAASAQAPARILPPAAARRFYAVADALEPPREGGPGAGDFDLAPHAERLLRHRGLGAIRRTRLLLAALDAWPRLTLRSGRGFAWLPREARAALFERWEHSRLGPLARTARELRALVAEAFAAAQSSAT